MPVEGRGRGDRYTHGMLAGTALLVAGMRLRPIGTVRSVAVDARRKPAVKLLSIGSQDRRSTCWKVFAS